MPALRFGTTAAAAVSLAAAFAYHHLCTPRPLYYRVSRHCGGEERVVTTNSKPTRHGDSVFFRDERGACWVWVGDVTVEEVYR
jgi:hypothetical protein